MKKDFIPVRVKKRKEKVSENPALEQAFAHPVRKRVYVDKQDHLFPVVLQK